MTAKHLRKHIQNMNSIEHVSRRFNHRYSLSDETSSGIVSDEEIDKQKLEAHYSYMAKIQEVSPEEFQFILVAIGTSVDQMRSECVDEHAALANLIANLTLDTEENKTVLKQLKKANTSLTQELKECKTNLDEYSQPQAKTKSIQTIHMLAPKCATYHGRSTFANPKYLKKAQSDKPRLYEIPYDTSDPANRFCPDGEG
ncbi:hypothetical protein Tco_0637859 [Tanacetum coccineum]